MLAITSQQVERKEIAGRWRFYPNDFFATKVDAIIDNKKFKVPMHIRGLKHLRKVRCKGHLRTRAEGKKSFCRKPNQRKNRVNTGGTVSICAGIIGGKLHLWHDVGKKWNGRVAADLYRGPLIKALRKHCGDKDQYLVAEDNDPSGYKTKKAQAAKDELGIKTIEWPRYSPDLNPLDFHVWHEIEEKVIKKLSKPVSLQEFKKRLRRAAKAMSQDKILKAVHAVKSRAKAVWEAGGGLIERD